MIIDVDDLHMVEAIIKDVHIIVDIDREVLRKMIIGSFLEDHRFIVAEIEEGKPVGFMFANVQQLDGENCAFIQACFSKKKGNVQVMLDKLISWSKEIGIKRMVFMSKRNPKAWQRKYKFNPIYTVMTRGV